MRLLLLAMDTDINKTHQDHGHVSGRKTRVVRKGKHLQS